MSTSKLSITERSSGRNGYLILVPEDEIDCYQMTGRIVVKSVYIGKLNGKFPQTPTKWEKDPYDHPERWEQVKVPELPYCVDKKQAVQKAIEFAKEEIDRRFDQSLPK